MNKLFSKILAASLVLAFLTACGGGDDGEQGEQGPMGQQGTPGTDGADGADGADGNDGEDGMDGYNSLVSQTQLMAGNMYCPAGGIQIDTGLDMNDNGMLETSEIQQTSRVCAPPSGKTFNRVASFPVCAMIDPTCDDDTETAAEIVAASEDGLTLIYTDSPNNSLGFVDITDPQNPVELGTVKLGGEPTSVAVRDNYALVGVNTSADFITTSGNLDVFDIPTMALMTSIPLGGQPDSVAVSPDGMFAAVAIENERDEDLGDGAPPQLPAGFLSIVDLVGPPGTWGTRTVALTGLPDLYPADPEPEYVDINTDNVAVVTLQENNYLVLIDLVTGLVTDHFSSGMTSLSGIDTEEESPARILQNQQLFNVLREPDGVTWVNDNLFATANEGDLNGGSRGFTVFNAMGSEVFETGVALDQLTARLGHYPDARSGNKGNEPENVEYGNYSGDRFLFVASERSSLIFVYDMTDPANPQYAQTLPAGVGPEGVLAIPSRNLLIAASEEDNRDDKIRSVLNIYRYETGFPAYPTIVSADLPSGAPIPWSAMSGLSADPFNDYLLYAIEDSYYQQNRIFTIDVSTHPATLTAAMRIFDGNDVLANLPVVDLADAGVDDDHPSRVGVFDEADLDAMINDDKSVNIDPEGVSRSTDGGFWVASEGSGTVGDDDRPINHHNLIFKTSATGTIEQVIQLPDSLNDVQLRFGFEGVAEYNGSVYVAFQRVWPGDTDVRIGRYNLATEEWTFYFYELDAPESQNGGWVGLSDLTSLGDGRFLVLERDNQGGPDAAIKRLYTVNLGAAFTDSVVTKVLVRDLMNDLAATGGLIPEKVEGSAVTADGTVYIINDNDGVEDNSGETQLIRLYDMAL